MRVLRGNCAQQWCDGGHARGWLAEVAAASEQGCAESTPGGTEEYKDDGHDGQHEHKESSEALRSIQVGHELAHDLLRSRIGIGGDGFLHLHLYRGAEFLAVGGEAYHAPNGGGDEADHTGN